MSVSIYDILLKRIIDLEYPPGELINEKQLTEEFSVSRTPVREALLKLSEKGFVQLIPRVGTYVSQVDIRDVKHAYEVKKNLEILACELAAERATSKDILELKALVATMQLMDPIEQYEEYIDADYTFRRKIRETSANPFLVSYLEELNQKTKRFVNHIQYRMQDPTWYRASMERIAGALADRNGQLAGEEMKQHAEIFLQELSGRFFI